MKRRDCLKLMGGVATASLLGSATGEASAILEPGKSCKAFGVSTVSFGASGKSNALRFPRFLRAGGFAEVTPTQAEAWWDQELLYVEFRNTETDALYRGNPGLAKPMRFPDTGRFQLSSYPDAVFVQYRSNWTGDKVHLFAVDSSGFCNKEGFSARVAREAEAWTASFEIPWKLLGGRPERNYFGLNLIRSRGQSSEILSPVALDMRMDMAADQMMFCCFADEARISSSPDTLIKLPDGTLRWQLPAAPTMPDVSERRELWLAQQRLDQPTDASSLSRRVHLAQRMHETLMLEGFSFHTDGSNWPVREGEYYPNEARQAVNSALRDHDIARACKALDVYLHQLNRVTKKWFADGSVCNIQLREWIPLTFSGAPRRDGNRLRLDAKAGEHNIPLWLSFCNSALRICGEQRGIFDAQESELVKTGSNQFRCGGFTLKIATQPWSITVSDGSGRNIWSVRQGQLLTRVSSSGEVLAFDLHGELKPQENVYGFGERFNALGQRGNVVTLWDVDCWEGNVHGLLNQAYKNVPLMHSTNGYSLFWNSTYRLRADIGNADPDRYRITAFGDIFDLFLWPTTPENALRSYTELTGRPIVPPRWALEPWMGGGGRRWNNGPFHNAVAEEIHAIKRFRELDIPHSAIYAEAGNGDPALYEFLKGSQLHVLAWVWGSMDIGKVRELFPGVADKRLPLLHHPDGSIVFRDEKSAIVDYTNPRSTELLRRFWKPRFDLGLAGSMVDFGDVVPEDAVFYNGKRGKEVHNFFAYYYHKAYAEVFQERHGNDYVLFARAGCAGDQRSICCFAGDHQANFFGMRAALTGGLNAAASGLSNWGADAGGYTGWPDPEVYIRWTEWATFCPLMRYHGKTPREPWEYGEDAVAIYKRYAWLRENLVPYIAESVQEAHETGVSLIRPMPMAFPESAELSNCDDQYMFGPDILVAPVVRPGESRMVKLPPGSWTDFWTAVTYEGPQRLRVETPIDRIGLFLRSGASIPVELGLDLKPGSSMTAGRIKAVIATGSEKANIERAKKCGASRLILYGHGEKRVVSVEGMQVTNR